MDATVPTGAMIGSLVVRGPDVHRLRPHLEDTLAAPADLHDDAPEFQVSVHCDDEIAQALISDHHNHEHSTERWNPTFYPEVFGDSEAAIQQSLETYISPGWDLVDEAVLGDEYWCCPDCRRPLVRG